MTDNNRFKKIIENPKFLKNAATEFRLIFKLLGDRRVSFWIKLIPIGTLVYFFVPEPIPFIDDIIVMSLGVYAFLEMCPEDIVEEHRIKLYNKKVGRAEDVVLDEIARDVEQAQFDAIVDVDDVTIFEADFEKKE